MWFCSYAVICWRYGVECTSHKNHCSGVLSVCKNSSAFHRTIPIKSDFLFFVLLCVFLSQRGQEWAVSRAATPEACVCEEDSVSYRSGPWCSGEHAFPGLLQRPCQAHQRPAVWRVSLNFCVCAQDIPACFSEKNCLLCRDVRNAVSGSKLLLISLENTISRSI